MNSFMFCFICLLSSYGVADENKSNVSEEKSIEPKHLNFIFYLADDQDQLDYGCYGNPNVKTSNVDRLAAEGMRFTNFYTAQAICAPSRSQIFTGKYPLKNGCMANHLAVNPDLKSVATYLKDAGYEVVLAGKSHVKPSSVFNWTKHFKSINNRFLPLEGIDSYLKNAKGPFCIFITSEFPHGPFPKVSSYTKSDIFKLPYAMKTEPFKTGYYQNIENDNEQLGQILKMVDDYNLRNNSIFIYASDHGISGKWSLREEGIKVPFIVRWPEEIQANSVSNTLLSFVDVLPTFLDIAQVEVPDDLDGKSFLKTLKGSKEKIHDHIFGVATKQNIRECKVFPSRMVRDSRFKLIRNYNSHEVYESNLGNNPFVNEFIRIGAESFPKLPYEELYDLDLDPYQTNNLARNLSYHDVKQQLSEALENWMKEQNDFLVGNKMPLLKPTLHPLDKPSKWNKVRNDLKEKLVSDNYIKLHY